MPRPIIFLLLLILIFHLVHFYPELPDKVASHFNGAGEPDNWSSKGAFVSFIAIISFFVTVFSVWVMFLIEHVPIALLNLPNKDYWMAEERRSESLLRIRQMFEWFSIGMLLLINVVVYFTLRANIHREPLSSGIWFVILGFLAFTIIWIVFFVRKFRIPE